MTPMDEQPVSPAIRIVIAAPFPEIVGLHERVGEYADQLDVCGAVMDASGVVDQTRVLQPEVLVLSDRLAEVADIAARLAAVAPATRLVLLQSGPDPVHPSSLADGTVNADAPADTLRRTIVNAAGRHLPDIAPAAHAREESGEPDPGSDAPTWFWETPTAGSDEDGEVPTSARATGATTEQAEVDPGAVEEPADEVRHWPPPWFRTVPAGSGAVATSDASPSADEPGGGEVVPAGSDAPLPGWNPRSSPEEDEPRATGELPATAADPPEQTSEERDAEGDLTPLSPDPLPRLEASEDQDDGKGDDGAESATDAAGAVESEVAADAPAVTEAAVEPEPETEAEFVPAPPPRRRKRPGRTRAETVLVFSGKGGVGKSVIATNLAVALSKAGSAVVIVDLNLQYGDVGVLLHLEAHPTSIEALAQQGEQIDREFLDEVLATGPEQVRALLAPTSPEFADLVTAANLRAVLRELGRTYDYIIVDSGSHLEELVLEVMEMADQVLMVTSFNITAVKDAKITLKLLESLGIEGDRIAVVLNQTKAKIGFPRGDIEKSLRLGMLAHLPYEPRIDDTIDSGKPMVLTEPKSDFAKQIHVIVEYLTPEEVVTGAAADRQKVSKRRFGFGR